MQDLCATACDLRPLRDRGRFLNMLEDLSRLILTVRLHCPRPLRLVAPFVWDCLRFARSHLVVRMLQPGGKADATDDWIDIFFAEACRRVWWLSSGLPIAHLLHPMQRWRPCSVNSGMRPNRRTPRTRQTFFSLAEQPRRRAINFSTSAGSPLSEASAIRGREETLWPKRWRQVGGSRIDVSITRNWFSSRREEEEERRRIYFSHHHK